MGGRITSRTLAVIATAILVAALVALLVQATTGETTLVDEAKTALSWLAVALAGGALALWTWWNERRRADERAAEAKARAREELDREIALREEDLRDRDGDGLDVAADSGFDEARACASWPSASGARSSSATRRCATATSPR